MEEDVTPANKAKFERLAEELLELVARDPSSSTCIYKIIAIQRDLPTLLTDFYMRPQANDNCRKPK
jgi:hypothetical protein